MCLKTIEFTKFDVDIVNDIIFLDHHHIAIIDYRCQKDVTYPQKLSNVCLIGNKYSYVQDDICDAEF